MTIWFTGLSGSGKSTVAHATIERLAEFGRNCSLLDGDEIRTHLSKGLGFSKEDRDTNIRRVGYVAGLIAQHGGTTLCSVISPYRAIRDEARKMSKGNFVEVYCSTPIDVCEQRDVKGMYAKARAAVADGKPMGFTGVDDPYEPPLEPRGHARHQQALGPGVRRRHHRQAARAGLHPAARAHRRVTDGRPERADPHNPISPRPGRPDSLGAVGPVSFRTPPAAA